MTKYQEIVNHIDLRGTPCPVNYIRCCLALEELQIEDILQVNIDRGEPLEMVVSGLREAGHTVEIVHRETTWVRLSIVCGSS